jgi:hypothetical protein
MSTVHINHIDKKFNYHYLQERLEKRLDQEELT